MKTQLIEIDDDTASVLKQRAEERGLSVPRLVAELVTLEAEPVRADDGEIAELDRRWKAFKAQGSAPRTRRLCSGCRSGALRHSGIGVASRASDKCPAMMADPRNGSLSEGSTSQQTSPNKKAGVAAG
jgi:hypothetical protein